MALLFATALLLSSMVEEGEGLLAAAIPEDGEGESVRSPRRYKNRAYLGSFRNFSPFKGPRRGTGAGNKGLGPFRFPGIAAFLG